jgi:hypothetical protein
MFKNKINIKNVMIFYNLITIIKYLLINKDILLIDFNIDFIILNILLLIILLFINTFIKINNNIIINKKNNI